MFFKKAKTKLSFLFFLIPFLFFAISYTDFNITFNQQIVEMITKQFDKSMKDASILVADLNKIAFNFNDSTQNLKNLGCHFGSDLGKEISTSVEKMVTYPIRTDSKIIVSLDDKTYELLRDMWLFIKERGPRMGSGFVLMSAGLIMLCDSFLRNTNNLNGWKIAEICAGTALTAGGLYLTCF